MDQLTVALAKQILSQARETDQASIMLGGTEHPFEIQSVTIPLDTARDASNPYVISFPFKTIFVRDATDSGVSVNFYPNTVDTYQSPVPLKLNDANSYATPVAKGYLTWSAQAGKTITLIFFVSASFQPGSQISTGTQTITEGSSITTQAKATVTTAAAVLLAKDLTRKVANIQNQGGSSIYLGDSGVTNKAGANPGLEVPPGATFIYKNTAAIYAIADASCAVAMMVEA